MPDALHSQGYAHVAFATVEDAAAAQQRNGADVLGRPMRVAPEAKRLVPRSAGDAAAEAPAAAAAPAGGIASSTRAYVTGLPYDAESAALEAALRAAFAGCGSGPQRVRLGLDRTSGAFRGYAHVDFADAAATDAAVARSGAVVCGRAVRVTRAVDKPDKLQQPRGARQGHARGRDAARSDGGEA
jgi:RNA recognition motif-containing protein